MKPKHNPYQAAKFLTSAPSIKQCPADNGAEIAFAGRSNAGKSSAINTISGQKSLARTSKTPGRTQLLNFFTIDEERRLVDLPGYGYAKVPKKMKDQWVRDMEGYLQGRESLRGLVLVMDIRHPMTEFDLQMLNWCRTVTMPTHILLTKSDKIKFGPAKATMLQVQRQLSELGVNASVQLFSALKRSGIEEAHAVMNQWLELE